MKKWYKKIDINPNNYDLRNLDEYSKVFFKLILIYCNLKDSGNKLEIKTFEFFIENSMYDNIYNHFINELSHVIKEDLKILKILNKFYNYLNKNGTIEVIKYNNPKILRKEENDLEYFLQNFLYLKSRKNIFINIKTNVILIEKLKEKEFINYILTSIDKDLKNTKNSANIYIQIKKQKYYKQFFDLIIYTFINKNKDYNKDILKKLLDFYIKRILNGNLLLLSNKNNNNYFIYLENNIHPNYMTYFRIKKYFIFSLFFENEFSFTIIHQDEMNPNITELRDIFSNLMIKEEDKKDRKDWWKHRINLENRLCKCLISLQSILIKGVKEKIKNIYLKNENFINHIKMFLIKTTKKRKHNLEEMCENMIEILLGFNNFIYDYDNETKNFIREFYNLDNFNLKKNKSQENCFFDFYDERTIHLIMSTELSNIPIENLPIFFNLPIVRTLNYNLIQNKEKFIEMEKEDLFYLLNPAKDLKETEEYLKPLFESKLDISGLTGKEPTKIEMEENLNKIKCFIYCGHSNGCKYIDPNFIKYSTNLNFVSFLMGCKSVKIDNMSGGNQFDIATYYQLNGWYIILKYLFYYFSPSLLGCLWNVTDADIDRFSKIVFEMLFLEKKTKSILEAVLYAKNFCKLKYLNSSALVIYSNSDLKIIPSDF